MYPAYDISGAGERPFTAYQRLTDLNAAHALAIISKERGQSEHSNLQLQNMFSVGQPVSRSTVKKQLIITCTLQDSATYRAQKDGPIWRLVWTADEGAEEEEVVASFQGVLAQKDMAPFDSKTV